MNRVASSVSTGITCAPASIIRRQSSTALYAAIPPETPSTTRRPRQTSAAATGGSARVVGRSGVTGLGELRLRGERGELLLGRQVPLDDLADLDLLEGDRKRLARHRGHLRRHDLAEALTEVVVVVVDLPGPARCERHERELR